MNFGMELIVGVTKDSSIFKVNAVRALLELYLTVSNAQKDKSTRDVMTHIHIGMEILVYVCLGIGNWAELV